MQENRLIEIITISTKAVGIPHHIIQAANKLDAHINCDISDDASLGKRKVKLISSSQADWLLLLDTDEDISNTLINEIKQIVRIDDSKYNGYLIPYRNYAFGRQVTYGGEQYSKIRLFRRKYGLVTEVPIHEEVQVTGEIGKLTGKIIHKSFRNPLQVFKKFTRYSWLVSDEKQKNGEKVTYKKLFFYAPHMFWARAIKDQGWKDGWRGILLALFFAYMEGLTYWLLLYRNLFHR